MDEARWPVIISNYAQSVYTETGRGVGGECLHHNAHTQAYQGRRDHHHMAQLWSYWGLPRCTCILLCTAIAWLVVAMLHLAIWCFAIGKELWLLLLTFMWPFSHLLFLLSLPLSFLPNYLWLSSHLLTPFFPTRRSCGSSALTTRTLWPMLLTSTVLESHPSSGWHGYHSFWPAWLDQKESLCLT